MAISLDAIYQPLNQFFLQKFGQPEGAPVFFRFAQVPVGVHDSDFVVPSHPEWGSSPALAVEQLSNLVDKITRLDATAHGVWLDDASRISDLYHDEILGPSLPFLSSDLDADTKQQVIDSFSQVKSDAISRWENSKAASLLNPGTEFRPSGASPPSWWKPDADVWTPKEFLIQGAATAAPDQSATQLLRMKISDSVMQPILMQYMSSGEPPAPAPVASAQQQSTMLSHLTLKIARPMFAATMARANIGPQVAAIRPAAQPVFAAGRPDLSVAMHSDLMGRAARMSLRQRMELQSVLTQSAPTQSVTVTDVTISFDYCLVTVGRPWIQTSFLNSRSWFIPGQPKGSLSANDGHGVPALPTGFIALKNLSIKGPWTPADITNLEQSIQFGPFLIDSTVVNGAIGHTGIQVVGWILQDMPDLPPLDTAAPEEKSPSPPADASSSPPSDTTSSPASDASPSPPSDAPSSPPAEAASSPPADAETKSDKPQT